MSCDPQDPCLEVRKEFGKKLGNRLLNLSLPGGFLSVFLLAASEPDKQQRAMVSPSQSPPTDHTHSSRI